MFLFDSYEYKTVFQAKWAVFFNFLEIPYEHKSPKSENDFFTRYDFWLPSMNYWIVSAIHSTDLNAHRLINLQTSTTGKVYAFIGFPDVEVFLDQSRQDRYVREICNFNILMVDEDSASCRKVNHQTLNTGLISILEPNFPTNELEYLALTNKLTKAAEKGNERFPRY